jgi:hypothetical protein
MYTQLVPLVIEGYLDMNGGVLTVNGYNFGTDESHISAVVGEYTRRYDLM